MNWVWKDEFYRFIFKINQPSIWLPVSKISVDTIKNLLPSPGNAYQKKEKLSLGPALQSLVFWNLCFTLQNLSKTPVQNSAPSAALCELKRELVHQGRGAVRNSMAGVRTIWLPCFELLEGCPQALSPKWALTPVANQEDAHKQKIKMPLATCFFFLFLQTQNIVELRMKHTLSSDITAKHALLFFNEDTVYTIYTISIYLDIR